MVDTNKHKIGLFGFFAITATMVMTVYEYPAFATSGFSLVFFLLLGGVCWFIPYALMAAEMATVENWQEGGIFTWVGKTLGERQGFASIFYQWFQITVGIVTMIYFILGALSYVIGWNALHTNPTVEFFAVLIIIWGLTFIQFGGTKYTERIAKLGFIIGVVIPAIILLVLGLIFLGQGHKSYVVMNSTTFFPDFSKLPTLVIFVSFILAYMGVEASATHVNEMINPKRNYPLAILILVIVAIVLNSIGGIIIAAVIPNSQLSLNAGVVQTFESLILTFNHSAKWVVRIIALMIAFGVTAEISAWLIGPIKGIHVAATHGILPQWTQKQNSRNVPTTLLIIQGIVISIWDAVLTFGGGGANVSFLTAISLTVVIYLIGYLLFSLSYLNLVIKHKDYKRVYHAPFGNWFKILIGVVSFIVSIFALIISFIPPSALPASSHSEYLTILVVCAIISIIIPFAIYTFTKRNKNSVRINN